MHYVVEIIVPLGIAFMMLCVGMTTSLHELKGVLEKPRAFVLGALLQLISLPLIAIVFAAILNHFQYATPSLILGILLLAVCPGGVSSNVFTLLSRGNTALSISLTTSISLLGLVFIPLMLSASSYIIFGKTNQLENTFFKISLGVFLFTTLPLVAGLIYKHYKPQSAHNFEKKTRNIVLAFFAAMIIAAVVENKELVIKHFATLLPIALVFNLCIITLSYICARKLKLSGADTIAITYECGFQNNGLAILIALNVLKIEEAAIFAGAFSPVMYTTALFVHSFTRKLLKS